MNRDEAEQYVEVTLDVGEGSAAVQSIKTVTMPQEVVRKEGPEQEDHVKSTLTEEQEKRSRWSSMVMMTKAVMSLSKLQNRHDPDQGHVKRSESTTIRALQGLKFISKARWDDVAKKFDEITASTPDRLLPSSCFHDCIGMREKEFAGRLFNALARRLDVKRDSICKDELKLFWNQISDQRFESRLQIFFDMIDKDADGKITEEEIKEIIIASASANKLSNIQKQAEEYAESIMKELDKKNRGYIMIENLEILLMQGTSQSMRGDSTKNLSAMISQKLNESVDTNPISRFCTRTKYFLLDYWQRIWIVALWILVMVGLYAYKYLQYTQKPAFKVMGPCVCLAKGAAETLKLNMALILLPVCRKTLTWLRNRTKLGAVVPFDDNLNFHMMIAGAIGIGVVIHSVFHLACDFQLLLNASKQKWKLMQPFFGDQPTSYWQFVWSTEGVTGIVMVVLMAVAFTLATPWFRQNKLQSKLPVFMKRLTGFNAFWYSHHLFIIVYILLIVHGYYLYLIKEWYNKTTWMYVAVPVVLYAIERLTKTLRSSFEAVSIHKVRFYPGDVLALYMSRPHGFNYRSGQYMFVNCSAVSPFEWHPFSITSAPDDDCLSVHIRKLGDWTGQIQRVFSKVCQNQTTGKSEPLQLRASSFHASSNLNFPRVLIDGPYGAPAQDYRDYEVVLLIGLGIGATPMISIVKDIVNNSKFMEEQEQMNKLEHGTSTTPHDHHSHDPLKRREEFKTRRAYFYWMTKYNDTFDWFKEIMNEVAELDHNHLIEFHNYCTCVYEEGDARSTFIQLLQSINHAKSGVDIVSGTRVKSHFAKPNWRDVYKRIATNHVDTTVGVFYCGQAGAMKELRHLASDFSHKTTTKFQFHKENF